jgi:hypothetical protein
MKGYNVRVDIYIVIEIVPCVPTVVLFQPPPSPAVSDLLESEL